MLDRKKERRLPAFKRQEWFRYKRLGDHWRRPKGLHSKMRTHKGYRPPVVRVGYRTPSKVRGLHPSGFKEVLVRNPSDLDGLDPEKEAVRIGHTVGLRKRIDIVEKADSLNIRVLNRRGL
ncbi:MAG: 50S ribosomal protein L32e [Thermoplasmata archaeon]|nr:50S ribosomal protein L32e [Thermoplasmata archaeon]